MRNLKYALLGQLYLAPMTGYDLMKQFESTLHEFWSANHSQIYPELRKLCEEGCISYRVEIAGTSLEKKLYSITDKGRQEFTAWLRSETPAEPTPKEVSRLKLFYSGFLPPQERLALIDEQLARHTLRLRHLQSNQSKFSAVPDKADPALGDYLVLLGAIMREETTCEWLKKCRELCS